MKYNKKGAAVGGDSLSGDQVPGQIGKINTGLYCLGTRKARGCDSFQEWKLELSPGRKLNIVTDF